MHREPKGDGYLELARLIDGDSLTLRGLPGVKVPASDLFVPLG